MLSMQVGEQQFYVMALHLRRTDTVQQASLAVERYLKEHAPELVENGYVYHPLERPDLYDLAYKQIEMYITANGGKLDSLDKIGGVVRIKTLKVGEIQERIIRIVGLKQEVLQNMVQTKVED